MEEQRDWQRTIPLAQRWGGCRYCIHFQPMVRCTAYPDGIPTLILSGQVDHLVPRPGQVDEIVFEPRTEPAGRFLGRANPEWKAGSSSRHPIEAANP